VGGQAGAVLMGDGTALGQSGAPLSDVTAVEYAL
jgi:hypothetical protein